MFLVKQQKGVLWDCMQENEKGCWQQRVKRTCLRLYVMHSGARLVTWSAVPFLSSVAVKLSGNSEPITRLSCSRSLSWLLHGSQPMSRLERCANFCTMKASLLVWDNCFLWQRALFHSDMEAIKESNTAGDVTNPLKLWRTWRLPLGSTALSTLLGNNGFCFYKETKNAC